MRNELKEKRVKLLEKYVPYFIIACVFAGALFGSLLYFIFEGEFPYEVITSALIVAVVLTVIQLVKQKRKKHNIPDADERTAKNVFRFLAITSHASLGLLVIGLVIFTLSGYESIPIHYIWIFFSVYIWVAGIGVIIATKR